MLIDGLTENSVDWENRKLYASDGTDVILDWNTAGTADFSNTNITTTGNLTTGIHASVIGSGGAAGLLCDRTDGKPVCFISTSDSSKFMFDSSNAFQIAGNSAANIEAFNAAGRTTVCEFTTARVKFYQDIKLDDNNLVLVC